MLPTDTTQTATLSPGSSHDKCSRPKPAQPRRSSLLGSAISAFENKIQTNKKKGMSNVPQNVRKYVSNENARSFQIPVQNVGRRAPARRNVKRIHSSQLKAAKYTLTHLGEAPTPKNHKRVERTLSTQLDDLRRAMRQTSTRDLFASNKRSQDQDSIADKLNRSTDSIDFNFDDSDDEDQTKAVVEVDIGDQQKGHSSSRRLSMCKELSDHSLTDADRKEIEEPIEVRSMKKGPTKAELTKKEPDLSQQEQKKKNKNDKSKKLKTKKNKSIRATNNLVQANAKAEKRTLTRAPDVESDAMKQMKRRMKEIQDRLDDIKKDTERDIKAMREDVETRKKTLAEEAKKKILKDDGVKVDLKATKKASKKTRQEIESLRTQNRALRTMADGLKFEIDDMAASNVDLQKANVIIAGHIRSLTKFIQKAERDNNNLVHVVTKCKHKYIPNHKEALQWERMHTESEVRVAELYRGCFLKIGSHVSAWSKLHPDTSSTLYNDVSKMIATCGTELEAGPSENISPISEETTPMDEAPASVSSSVSTSSNSSENDDCDSSDSEYEEVSYCSEYEEVSCHSDFEEVSVVSSCDSQFDLDADDDDE